MMKRLPLGEFPYRSALFFLRGIFRCLGGLTLVGEENIPAEGGVILASNHLSHVDPPALSSKTKRHVRFMAKAELWHPKPVGWWMDSIGNFPVRRGTADRRAIKKAIDLLEEGWVIAIFPEGTRSRDGTLGEPEMGIGLIVMKAKCPVVPTVIFGTDKILPVGDKRLHRNPAKVVFGKPVYLDDIFEQKESREGMAEIGRRIMTAIAELQAAGE